LIISIINQNPEKIKENGEEIKREESPLLDSD
jgi:hypothetical protein